MFLIAVPYKIQTRVNKEVTPATAGLGHKMFESSKKHLKPISSAQFFLYSQSRWSTLPIEYGTATSILLDKIKRIFLDFFFFLVYSIGGTFVIFFLKIAFSFLLFLLKIPGMTSQPH